MIQEVTQLVLSNSKMTTEGTGLVGPSYVSRSPVTRSLAVGAAAAAVVSFSASGGAAAKFSFIDALN